MDTDELIAHEAQVRQAVTVDLRGVLDQLERTILAVYTAAAGSTRHKLPPLAQATIRRQLVDALDRIHDRTSYAATRATLSGAARRTVAAGARGTGLDPIVSPALPADIRAAFTALTAGMRADLAAAARLARHGRLERYGDAYAVLMAARKALNRADRAATWTVHRAHDEGVRRAVDRAWSHGVQVARLWRSERNACARCAGFNGAIALPGEDFLPLFEAGDASAGTGPLSGPPAHPFCRCITEEWSGPTADADLTPVDLPYALRREAQRAVAAGHVQGSEPARLRAADRLLDVADLLIPKTAQRRAAGAVAAGTFDR